MEATERYIYHHVHCAYREKISAKNEICMKLYLKSQYGIKTFHFKVLKTFVSFSSHLFLMCVLGSSKIKCTNSRRKIPIITLSLLTRVWKSQKKTTLGIFPERYNKWIETLCFCTFIQSWHWTLCWIRLDMKSSCHANMTMM